jgi:adenylate kinase family enzyme
MQRITIIGTSCAGKSTLANRLATVMGVPHIELDALHWEPGWIEAPNDVFRPRVAAAVAGEAWVTDGNYSVVRDLVWSRSDTIVWLDYSFPRIFWQSIKRTFRRSVAGERCCNGNRESLRRALGRDSILLWVVKSHFPKRRKYLADLPKLEGTRVVILRSPKAAEKWLEEIRAMGTRDAISTPHGEENAEDFLTIDEHR